MSRGGCAAKKKRNPRW